MYENYISDNFEEKIQNIIYDYNNGEDRIILNENMVKKIIFAI